VGRVVEALDELAIRDRTIVIFTTDNGTSGGVLGTIGGKRPSGGKATKFEGGVCEPFLVNCPGLVPAGVETDALADFADLLPTFAELAGAAVPEGLAIDGRSLAPLLLGRADDSPRRWIMAMGHGAAALDADGVRGKNDYADRVIRDKRYKAWVDTDKRIAELYDLKNDPLEQNNLIESTEPDVRAAIARFQAVVDATPDRDARPQYRQRAPLPWDRKPTGGDSPAKPKGRKAKKRR